VLSYHSTSSIVSLRMFVLTSFASVRSCEYNQEERERRSL